MITILVIDDEVDLEHLLRSWFRRQIQQQTYTFLFACNGPQGLSLLQEEPAIDIVLLDINMPQMNGLDLLTKISALNLLIGTVMVSAYGDISNIRTAMNRGAFDFVTKPIDFTDLVATIDKTVQYVRQRRESQQLKVISELKARFFDNITHEFRTPLTLILSPVGKLLQQTPPPDELRRQLRMVERNAQKLLRLINQLLDLAKLDSGQLTLTNRTGDLTRFVGQIVQTFAPLADERQIDLRYDSDLTGYQAFDGEKIEQIVYNLLMNALKFTRVGHVRVQLQQGESIRLVVADTGVGIAADKLPVIFDRFYQVLPSLSPNGRPSADWMNTGTGIGLALVRELTELMNGTVSVQSTVSTAADEPSGTVFTINLPLPTVQATQYSDREFSDPQPATVGTEEAAGRNSEPLDTVGIPAADSDRNLVLVVEDNAELRSFIARELSVVYRVLTARDGAEGWELARTELPDIVLTDVMMPGLDGYELTHRLKQDDLTSHIAVVMLTARSAQPSRLEGLKHGADEYISKPFHLDELYLRLRNLLTRQQALRVHYEQLLSAPSAPELPHPVPDKFIQKLQACIEARLDDSQFGVEALAFAIGMSRRSLYRKLMAVANLNINDFIRRYRLRRALQFLREGHNVSETAYLVGYESPGHFSTVFKEFYQKTPTEFLKS
ncbi:response regulator [Spirosoma rigui]|uniref:response regulator n=1 Tax=Spirosoma rigui TaxID=564064 RepID=UPI0009B15258|nr:response regulator [Spirosoma rigui]